MPTETKQLYLTFDDGPTPEVTSWILSQLGRYQVKATFFCVGNNVEKHPEIYKQLLEQGHTVGNHTYNHLNGWKNKTNKYLDDIEKCAELVKSDLFRPPYGKLRFSQARSIRKKYRIVLWDVLSGDFDRQTSKEKCLNNILKNTQPGSIIVLHGNIKTFDKLKFVLPRVLEHFTGRSFEFKAL